MANELLPTPTFKSITLATSVAILWPWLPSHDLAPTLVGLLKDSALQLSLYFTLQEAKLLIFLPPLIAIRKGHHLPDLKILSFGLSIYLHLLSRFSVPLPILLLPCSAEKGDQTLLPSLPPPSSTSSSAGITFLFLCKPLSNVVHRWCVSSSWILSSC